MKKGGEGKEWIEKLLLAYRTTPNNALDGYSPYQLFFGRRLRTKLSLVHPKGQFPDTPMDMSRLLQAKKSYAEGMSPQFDERHGAKLVEFLPGDPVLLLNYYQGKSH